MANVKPLKKLAGQIAEMSTGSSDTVDPSIGGTGVNNSTNTITVTSNATISGTNTGDNTVPNSLKMYIYNNYI